MDLGLAGAGRHESSFDPTGAYAGIDNAAPVYFIAGTASGFAGPPIVDRTFTVPAGEPLLIPILNDFDSQDPKHTEREDLKVFRQDVTGLFAEIDGVRIAHLHSDLVTTGFFSMGPTQPGSLAEAIGGAVGVELSPTKASGYWLMVEGLKPGPHTLEFGGSLSTSFSTMTTDHIVVVAAGH